MRLSFINANWLRQYPFRSDSGITDVQNNTLPTSVIVGLRLTVPAITSDVFIQSVKINNGVVGVEIWMGSSILGTASGAIINSNQSLPVIAPGGGSLGTVTIGDPNICQISASYTFNNSTALGFVEPSTVSVIPSPAVSAWTVQHVPLTGDITFDSNSLNITGNYLSVITPGDVASRGDKHPEYLTCDQPVIGAINNVLPDVNHNIRLVAIEPLKIEWLSGSSVFKLYADNIVLNNPTSGQKKICDTLNLPPDTETSVPTGTLETTSPEYKTWPQFN